jgi:hypothetical protein
MTCRFSHFESRRPGNDKKVATDNAARGAETEADTGLLREAAAELYAGDPAGFIRRRGDLSAQARASGEGAAAKAIASLRKPTRSAWVVNRLVRTDPDAASRLTALGDDLRAAGRSLDGRRLRELSQARRDLIAALTRQALTGAGLCDPAEALREEVIATLSAALADPQVAAELAAGALVRPVERSGFGFGPSDADGPLPATPSPTGKRAAPGRPERTEQAERPGSARGERQRAGPRETQRERAGQKRAERDRAERERARAAREQAKRAQAIATAERMIDAATRAAAAAQSAERACAEAVRDLEQQLDDAHDRLAGAKRTSRAAAAALRDARRALDRLQRAPVSR